MKPTDSRQACPCGSNQPFAQCCEALIHGNKKATSPEALMRSRYSAYVQQAWHYIHQSWHPHTRPSSISPTSTQWLGLTIVATNGQYVEFIAGFKEDGKVMKLHEISLFRKDGEAWKYFSGKCTIQRVKRNELCPCGSHKKCKQCCGKLQNA